ncbi:MAG: hypothetical protein NTX56_19515, partial [Proteobacteria bacterium]|nr:hypothetical protein [Pseudomonadota bacterium]
MQQSFSTGGRCASLRSHTPAFRIPAHLTHAVGDPALLLHRASSATCADRPVRHCANPINQPRFAGWRQTAVELMNIPKQGFDVGFGLEPVGHLVAWLK